MMAYAGIAAYKKSSNQLVAEHASLVNRIAHHLMLRLPKNIQLDDLTQAGMLGLLEAAAKYDCTKGASFETYAGIRIRGAMLDEVRRGDWAPRSVHRNSRRVSQAIRDAENRKSGEVSDSEIAKTLGVGLKEYFIMLNDSIGCRLFSYDEIFDTEDPEESRMMASVPGILDELHERQFQRRLAEAIAVIPEREQLVLSLYYDDELNLKEIGEVLGVSESRVSQIHTQATLRLRARLSDWER